MKRAKGTLSPILACGVRLTHAADEPRRGYIFCIEVGVSARLMPMADQGVFP
jgi:hypothetical protein